MTTVDMRQFSKTPDRSLQQRLSALEAANEIRSYRAALKKRVKAGMVSVPDLLTEPPELILTMKVSELMLAMPKHGPVKVNGILRRCEVSPAKTVGGLSRRQRGEIAARLRARS